MLATLQGVSKSYRTRYQDVAAIKDVTFAIDRAEFAVMMGPSGSGKTTLLHLIGLITRPTAGKVIINGEDVEKLGDSHLSDLRNRSIGFVFQSFSLVPVLTALQNVALPLDIQGVAGRESQARAHDVLARVGLAGFTHHLPGQLSGGQKQRVAVARALVTNPLFVLADEPTANLDTTAALDIIGLMSTLCAERAVTFLIATHDQRLLEHAHRRILLLDGRIVEDVKIGSRA